MISLITQNKLHPLKRVRIGSFRSYRAIANWLSENGETGIYYAIPTNIKSLAGIKEIHVCKYWNAESDREEAGWDREIEMEGSYC